VKTYSLLERDDVSEEQVTGLFRGRDTVELLRAVHTPDHTATAVRRVTDALHQRGVADEQIAAFQSDWNELSVMPLGRPPTLQQALRRPRRWRRIHRGMQLMGLLVLLASIPLFLWDRERHNALVGVRNMVIFLCWVPTFKALLWTWPARILLLRPFGTATVSKGLKRFVRRNVAFTGHVFTLADQHMKESGWRHVLESIPKSWEEVVVFVACLVRLMDTPRRKLFIKRAYHFRVLRRRLARRYLLNTMWATSFDGIRKIRTSDRWWQRCIDLLTVNVEVILVDLSVVKSGTRWELRKISKERLERKAIFVVQQDRLEAARGILAEHWPADHLPEIFAYDGSGIPLAKGAFEQRMAETLALPRPAFTGRPRREFNYWITLLLGWVPGLGWMFSAILSSRVRRSEGRLLGSHLALFMFVFSLGLLGVVILRGVLATP
jgi:hypothetical protein